MTVKWWKDAYLAQIPIEITKGSPEASGQSFSSEPFLKEAYLLPFTDHSMVSSVMSQANLFSAVISKEGTLSQ